MATITNAEMERRKLIAAAQTVLTDAMFKFTVTVGELSPLEWIKAANEAIINRCLAEGLHDEWKGG